jgi:RHS repeat-associated protein
VRCDFAKISLVLSFSERKYPQRERCSKFDGSATTLYVNGSDGKTETLVSNSAYWTYNLWGLDNVGQSKRSGSALTRYYYVKDHLGDTRVTVNTSGGIDSYFDYYPFGQLMDSRCMTGSADGRYKYTGKERDLETGYDYPSTPPRLVLRLVPLRWTRSGLRSGSLRAGFGARYYDSRIGRWLGVDPDENKYPSWSAFNYCFDNPLRLIDRDGRGPELAPVAIGAAELVALGLAGGAAVATAVNAKGIAQGLNDASDYIRQNVVQPGVQIMNDLIQGGQITTQASPQLTTTSFPDATAVSTQTVLETQTDQGVQQATSMETSTQVGPTIPVKLKGGKNGKIQVHINTDAGTVHIQPIGGGKTHTDGIPINPSQNVEGQIKTLVKGPKSAIKKTVETVKKGLDQAKKRAEQKDQ